MKFDIHNRYTGAVQFTADIDCAEDAPRPAKIGLAVKWAIGAGVSLCESNLSRSNLSGSNLSGSNLSGSDLSESDLSWSNLSRSDLSRSDLRRSDLSGSNLSRSDLRESNLSGSDLSWSNLSGSDLSGSDLSGSNLSESAGISDRIIDGGLRSDGYRFLLTRTEPGEWRVKAGCRNYSLTDAKAHWNADDYRDGRLGDEAMLIVKHMVAVAKYRNWRIDHE